MSAQSHPVLRLPTLRHLEAYQELWRHTFPAHGLSFNSWLWELLEAGRELTYIEGKEAQ